MGAKVANDVNSLWDKKKLRRQFLNTSIKHIHQSLLGSHVMQHSYFYHLILILFVFLAKMCISLLEHVVEIIALWISVLLQRKVVGKGKSGHPCSDFCSYDEDQKQKMDNVYKFQNFFYYPF